MARFRLVTPQNVECLALRHCRYPLASGLHGIPQDGMRTFGQYPTFDGDILYIALQCHQQRLRGNNKCVSPHVLVCPSRYVKTSQSTFPLTFVG